MPFAGILEIQEPFLRGASQHPKEAMFQIGSSILNMVTSYHHISGDHLAEHMIHLSTASSFWFSLNSSYDHEKYIFKIYTTKSDSYFVNLAQIHDIIGDETWFNGETKCLSPTFICDHPQIMSPLAK